MSNSEHDYSRDGLTIRSALLKENERRGKNRRSPATGAARRPPIIRWGNKQVTTVDVLEAPASGRVRLEILATNTTVRQGVDIMMAGGCILDNGTLVPLLRTWYDDRFEPYVEYDYIADDGLIRSRNVYEVQRGRGPLETMAEEYCTENAGMWAEVLNSCDHICHCSHADSDPPDFENIVYRITVSEFEL